MRRRLVDILANGILPPASGWNPTIFDPDHALPDDPKRDFLRVAARLINDIGHKGASIDRIAGELNVTKGSFYHHLNAKDDLILECYRNDYRQLGRLRAMVEARSPGSSIDQLSDIVGSALQLQFDGSRPLMRTNAQQAMPVAVRSVALDGFERIAMWFAGVLIDGQAQGTMRIADPLIAAHVILSSLVAAYDLRGWARQQSPQDAIATYAHVLLNGLLSETAPPEC